MICYINSSIKMIIYKQKQKISIIFGKIVNAKIFQHVETLSLSPEYSSCHGYLYIVLPAKNSTLKRFFKVYARTRRSTINDGRR